MHDHKRIHTSLNHLAGTAFQSLSPIAVALIAILTLTGILLISSGIQYEMNGTESNLKLQF